MGEELKRSPISLRVAIFSRNVGSLDCNVKGCNLLRVKLERIGKERGRNKGRKVKRVECLGPNYLSRADYVNTSSRLSYLSVVKLVISIPAAAAAAAPLLC